MKKIVAFVVGIVGALILIVSKLFEMATKPKSIDKVITNQEAIIEETKAEVKKNEKIIDDIDNNMSNNPYIQSGGKKGKIN